MSGDGHNDLTLHKVLYDDVIYVPAYGCNYGIKCESKIYKNFTLCVHVTVIAVLSRWIVFVS